MSRTDFIITQGTPLPYGTSKNQERTNFSLTSASAKEVSLILYTKDHHPLAQFPFDPAHHKTGNVWHLAIDNLPPQLLYSYTIKDQNDNTFHILDPYAKAVSTPKEWGLRKKATSPYHPLGVIKDHELFDWEEDQAPKIPKEDLVIYEMHVRGFTIDESSQSIHKGTFLGITDKIPHLKKLGINAIELLPIQEFDENEYKAVNPLTGERLFQYWGYSSVNYFSLMNRYGSSQNPQENIKQFKTFVKSLHANGIEVILDVVFNHTAEGNENGPTLSFKGVDPSTYYLFDPTGLFLNYSGCGNTVNTNHPVVIELILNVLRYWVLEMHVDGFRFDLSSIFKRDYNGHPINFSPIVEAISEDPVLASIKLIAEPWDAVGLYHVGSFASKPNRWIEWNDKFRDTVRLFISGREDKRSEFATRLAGSQDLYYSNSPLASLNFITAHDGFSLADLVAYNMKHNLANGENNRDGTNNNCSWNCGVEGPTDTPSIVALRERQMRNFILALMVSSGIPMILMGDEYGHTREGNNNTWCQDNKLNWFDWNRLEQEEELFRFFYLMINFRKKRSLLKRTTFLNEQDICWHGIEPFKPKWEDHLGFIAYTLIDKLAQNDLYIAFNAQKDTSVVSFPPPPKHMKWHLVINTGLQAPNDIVEDHQTVPIETKHMKLIGFSALLLEAKKITN